MSDIVSFHILRQKFLEQESDIPSSDAVNQVMYYSLAIGHHVGVIDCLEKVFECPLDGYKTWIEMLPEGEARRKMTGLLTFSEITIDSEHIGFLGESWNALVHDLAEPYKEWTEVFLDILSAIAKEPVMYLMIKLPREML